MFRLDRSASRTLLATLLLVVQAGALRAQATSASKAGVDVAGMDRSVKPGDDFYRYANGTWMANTEIPADRSTYGAANRASELAEKRLAEIVQGAAKSNAPAGSEMRKIGDYYSSWLDEAAIEAAGLRPLEPQLGRIAAIADRAALSRYLGSTLRADVDALNATNFYTENLFGLWVAQDLDDPTRYSPFLLQGGLGLPDRSYYVDSSLAMVKIREGYLAHVAAMLKLAGIPDADSKAAGIVQLETRIAQAHWSREASGDVSKGNNHWARAEFATRAPGLDWAAFFAGAGLEQPPTFVVWQPSAISGIAALVASEPLDTWKDYLAFHAIQTHGNVLPAAIGKQSFAFYGATLGGIKVQRDRWKRAVSATDNALGFAIGKAYAERYFPASEKQRAETMVRDIIAAFDRRIDRLQWMAPATRAQAKAKLKVLKVGVGYPDKWPSYDGLEVKPGDAFGNQDRASLFRYQRSVAKLGMPVDRSEWVMTPQTVNAVNLPAMNAMNFPAAILQPPFFDPSRTPAMDYGAIGSVIGHEISHSFDNQGALFDAEGRLHNWWTPADFKHFQESADRLVKQYDAYRPFPDLAVNGKQTLGENIADVAGLQAAFDAYRLSLKGKAAPTVGGFTGDQQFFLSFAQEWRRKMREPVLRNLVLTDGHAPAQYRALTVRNVDPWYAAFGVKPGEALYLAPNDRVRVW